MTRTAGRLLVVLAGLLASLALAGPAAAHVGGGAAGSDFDARVLAVTPEVPGLSVRVLQFGEEVELVKGTGTEVVVPGYDDDPYLRIGPDGVWRNANSPATYINLDRYGRTTLPARAASARSSAGLSALHGPHQPAQKSTTTGSSRERCSTSAWKVASLTSTGIRPRRSSRPGRGAAP